MWEQHLLRISLDGIVVDAFLVKGPSVIVILPFRGVTREPC